MNKLKNIERVVEKILEIREDARSNDDILYLYVCEQVDGDVSLLTLEDFLTTRNKSPFPSFVSVTRARRKIFEKRPELKPKEVTRLREEMEQIYMDYAING